MKFIGFSPVTLILWTTNIWSMEIIEIPTAWYSQFDSTRNCELTTGSFGVDLSDKPIGTPGYFSLRFYHSTQGLGDYWFERLGYPAGDIFLAA